MTVIPDAPNFANCMSTEARVGRVTFPANDPYLPGALAQCGDYCHGEMQVYQAMLRQGMTVLDVGANIGLMSLLFSSEVGPSGTVHAFEPSGFTYGLLRHNLAMNAAENVVAHRMAVSDEVGQTDFVDPDASAIESLNFGTLSLDLKIRSEFGRTIRTEITTIDALDLDVCDFIKVDVEGYEAAVVRGGASTIRNHLPFLSIETGDPDHDLSWLSALRGLGYRVFVFSFFVFTWPNFKKASIEGFPSVVCVNAIGVPPGQDHKSLFGGIPRREVRDEADLLALCRRFSRDDYSD